MRISDWSSDVCSSYLFLVIIIPPFLDFRALHSRVFHPRSADDTIRLLITRRRVHFLRISTNATAPGRHVVAFLFVNEHTHTRRSEESRVGKEGVSTFRSRWSPYH